MKLTKFGKTLLMSALSLGLVLGVTSCVQSYTVGYLYVTGTQTAETTGNGIISGFKIDHNTGNLVPINGLPISSGGVNPGRAVLLNGGRFIYVLNQGTPGNGGTACTAATPCQASIAQFSIGGNGVLSPQGVNMTPQGYNSFRIISDSGGTYLYVLDAIAPSTSACSLALGTGVTSCGDITAYKVDSTTGRLTLVVNSQVTSASGEPLPYFPVPANPIDFILTQGYVLTLSGTQATGDSVFPYTYAQGTGQLTINQNSSQPLNISQATAIVAANNVYVLANDPDTYTLNGSTYTVPSQILTFTVGANGALQQLQGGVVPGDSTLTNPVYLIAENKGKWAYVAYQGSNNTTTGNTESGIAGWVIDPTTKQLNPEISGSPWGTGSGPMCLLEDPSYQFFYTANFNDSTVTGVSLDQNTGVLNPLSQNHHVKDSFALPGPAAWCLVTGRTS
ncbi:MAG TPA: beta-propeller fold lactonase family protein [Terracidiphilus sp.]|nr:beta-propeller fold lactonase family protein [Terracidiphilus sp.]